MLLPLLVQNLGPATGSGDLDFTVVEVVRNLRLARCSNRYWRRFGWLHAGHRSFPERGLGWLAHCSNFVGRLQQPCGELRHYGWGYDVAIFRLVPFINKYLTPHRFPSVVWRSTRYGPKSEPTSQ